jgi:hypothetical protein
LALGTEFLGSFYDTQYKFLNTKLAKHSMASPELTIELLKIYKSFADQINISADVSSMLHGVKDIKASGNEIEISLRTILKELLPNKYNISHGHIVDKDLNISRQYDVSDLP